MEKHLDAADHSYELVTTVDEAATACMRLAASAVLHVGLRTYPTGVDRGGGIKIEKPKKPPKPVPSDPYLTSIRLVQVAGRSGPVAIFDLIALGDVPRALRDLLTDDRFDCVGFEMVAIARALRRRHGIEIPNPIDLRSGAILAAGYADHKDPTLYTLWTEAGRRLGLVHRSDPHIQSWDRPTLSKTQLDEAARAVAVLRPLYAHIAAEVDRVGVGTAWGIENQVIPAIVSMEAVGFAVDRRALGHIELGAREEAERARDRVLAALGDPSLNLMSPDDLKRRVEAVYGIILKDAKDLTLEAAAEHAPALRDVLVFKRATKRMQAAERYLEAIRPDGKIHAQFDPMAAITGRLGCQNPPMLGVPKDDEFRGCFVADPGQVLVVADYSAAQTRIIADRTQDREMMRCLWSEPEIDLHVRTAAAVTGKPIDEVTRDERQMAKPVNFGVSFGMQPRGLMKYAFTFGVKYTLERATTFRMRFLELYSGIQTWHDQLQQLAQTSREVRSASGRLRSLQDDEARVSVLAASFAQGTEADGVKMALAQLHHMLKPLGGAILNILHDEVIVGAPIENAEAVKSVVVKWLVAGMSMFVRTVPVKVEAFISPTWAKVAESSPSGPILNGAA